MSDKENYFSKLRFDMVESQIAGRGINEKDILEVFKTVPRHLFVSVSNQQHAYNDNPVSIGENQTISQPYMVALMTQLLKVKSGEKILEIGTGSGYQSAILAHLGGQVSTIERIPSLAQTARNILNSLNYKVDVYEGDGSLGWLQGAPYNKIIVTAAAPCISTHWLEQLASPGRLIVPLGERMLQELTVVDKDKQGAIYKRTVCSCVFVPLIGKFGQKKD